MGSVYRRIVRHCSTCKKRLAKTADRAACTAGGHKIEERRSSIYWIRYARAGRAYNESSESDKRKDAVALLRDREGDIGRGKPVTPKIGKTTFDDAAADLLTDYSTNSRRSLSVVKRRIEKHLTPYFTGRRLADITTDLVRSYIAKRQEATNVVVRKARSVRMPDGTTQTIPAITRPASNAEINREVALLKRMFILAIQAGKVLYRPHIPMLKEDNVRTGFFEVEQYKAVMTHLPPEIQAVITFAYITGWRTVSEILPLEWRQVDFASGEVRLDPGTTKNRQGRTFHMSSDLRACLQAQHVEYEKLKKAGHICPYVFFRLVADERGGDKKPRRVKAFTKAWKNACRAAGCPDRIPHDLRRTAVRNMVRCGITERVCMRMTGHKTRSVFDRYDIVSDGDLRDAATKLDAAVLARG